MDMSVLISEQGDLVDQIGSHVSAAADYTGAAAVDMVAAVQHAKSAQRKRWVMLIVCLVLFVLLGTLLYFFVIKPML